MENACVVAVYATYDQARVGLEVLDMRGFFADSVSVVTGKDPEKVAERERLRRLSEVDAAHRAQREVRAAFFSLVAAQTLLGIPFGPLAVLGPLTTLFVSGGVAAARSFSGAISGQINEDTGRTYERYLRDGCVFVIVHASGDRLIDAQSGLKTTNTLSLETYDAGA